MNLGLAPRTEESNWIFFGDTTWLASPNIIPRNISLRLFVAPTQTRLDHEPLKSRELNWLSMLTRSRLRPNWAFSDSTHQCTQSSANFSLGSLFARSLFGCQLCMLVIGTIFFCSTSRCWPRVINVQKEKKLFVWFELTFPRDTSKEDIKTSDDRLMPC